MKHKFCIEVTILGTSSRAARYSFSASAWRPSPAKRAAVLFSTTPDTGSAAATCAQTVPPRRTASRINGLLVFPLSRNSRKTECGSGEFLIRLVVRTAPFALMAILIGTAYGTERELNACTSELSSALWPWRRH